MIAFERAVRNLLGHGGFTVRLDSDPSGCIASVAFTVPEVRTNILLHENFYQVIRPSPAEAAAVLLAHVQLEVKRSQTPQTAFEIIEED